MDELQKAVEKAVQSGADRFVFSRPTAGKAALCQKATVVQLGSYWQLERICGTKAMHKNVQPEGLPQLLCELLQNEFTQLTAIGSSQTYAVRLSKKGKVLTSSTKNNGPNAPTPEARTEHNREKNTVFVQGHPVAPLVDMGIFTQDGQVVAGRYDKYRQINRFVEQVDDVLRVKKYERLRVVDFGCGKSYLTFILYHYLRNMRGIDVDMCGLDLKQDVVQNCNVAAQKYGYDNLRFEVGDIASWQAGGPIDMVVSLHACDTATDEALAKALLWDAEIIFSVPCCQHELNTQMQSEELALLCRYGLVKERAAALITDAIRANLLTACGYKVQLLEFVGFEHTPKNIMIRAQKAQLPKKVRQKAYAEVRQMAAALSLSPCLEGLLQNAGRLPDVEI